MKKTFKKTVALLLVAVMLICGMSMSAFAAENSSSSNSAESSSGAAKIETRASVSVYTYVETLVYTGKGSDRWLHITPLTTPNRLTLRMVDYQGETVWDKPFVANGTTDWFIGSNVQYVYLSGLPGGVVNVWDTAN